MGGLNVKGVLLGGLAAGTLLFLLNGFLHGALLAKEWPEVLKSLHRPEPARDPVGMALFLALDLVRGLVATWLYAAGRPRFGPGPRTAILTGVAAGLLTGALPWLTWVPLGIFPVRFLVVAAAVETLATILATWLGGWIYNEE